MSSWRDQAGTSLEVPMFSKVTVNERLDEVGFSVPMEEAMEFVKQLRLAADTVERQYKNAVEIRELRNKKEQLDRELEQRERASL